jgi:hypothetical protein
MHAKPLSWDRMLGCMLHVYEMRRLIFLAYLMVLHTND